MSQPSLSEMRVRVCTCCKVPKSESDFGTNGIRGLHTYCRKCKAQKKSDGDKVRKETYKKLYPKLFAEEIAKQSIRSRKKYLKNKDLIKKRNAQYKKLNPELNKDYQSRRRASKRGSKAVVSSSEIKALVRHFNGVCAYCKCKMDKSNPMNIDHKVPISKGGEHVITNLLPACRICNLKKSAMDYDKWCEMIGFTDNTDYNAILSL